MSESLSQSQTPYHADTGNATSTADPDRHQWIPGQEMILFPELLTRFLNFCSALLVLTIKKIAKFIKEISYGRQSTVICKRIELRLLRDKDVFSHFMDEIKLPSNCCGKSLEGTNSTKLSSYHHILG